MMWNFLYRISGISGILLVIYSYLFAFDRFSETELVNLSILWIGLIVFSAHGMLAEKLLKAKSSENSKITRRNFLELAATFGIFSGLIQLFFFSAFFIPLRRSPVFAAQSAVLWLILLSVFLKLVFPLL